MDRPGAFEDSICGEMMEKFIDQLEARERPLTPEEAHVVIQYEIAKQLAKIESHLWRQFCT